MGKSSGPYTINELTGRREAERELIDYTTSMFTDDDPVRTLLCYSRMIMVKLMVKCRRRGGARCTCCWLRRS